VCLAHHRRRSLSWQAKEAPGDTSDVGAELLQLLDDKPEEITNEMLAALCIEQLKKLSGHVDQAREKSVV
jgi:hypothetical protein